MTLNLRTRITLYSVLLVLLPLAVTNNTLIQMAQDELKSSVNDSINTTSEQISKDIDSLYTDSWLAPLLLVASGVDNPLLGANEKVSLIQAGLQNITDMVSCQIQIFGLDTPILMTKDTFTQELENADLDASDVLLLPEDQILSLLQEEQQDVYSGDFQYIPETDSWLFTILIPLENPIADNPAVLIARVDLKRLKALIEAHPFQRQGQVTLIDYAGHAIITEGASDLDEYSIIQDILNLTQSEAPPTGVKQYTRPNQDVVVAGFAFPKHLDLSVLVEWGEKEAYYAVTEMTEFVMMITFTVLLLTIGIAFYFALRLSRPVEKITRIAESVGTGNLNQEINVASKTKEIRILSTSIHNMRNAIREQIDDLNRMIAKLKKRDQEISSLNQELEEKNVWIAKTSEAYSHFFPHKFLEHLDKTHITELELGTVSNETCRSYFLICVLSQPFLKK